MAQSYSGDIVGLVNDFLYESEGRYAKNTIRYYKYYILGFWDFCDKSIKDVDRNDLMNWIGFMMETRKRSSTINLSLTALRSFFNYCVEMDLIDTNPAKDVKKLKQGASSPPFFLNRTQLFVLLDEARGNLRDRAILEILNATGIRSAELIAIHLEDVDFISNLLWIRKGKGLNERLIPFTAECGARIKAYLETRDDNSPLLFVRNNGSALIEYEVWKVVNKYVKITGLPSAVNPRAMRHTYATNLKELGFPLEYLAFLLGHKTLQYVPVYAHLTSKLKKSEYDKHT